MKILSSSTIYLLLCFTLTIGCTNNESVSQITTVDDQSANVAMDEKSNESSNAQSSFPPDICRCLTEPGNSQWAIDNRDACNAAISKELGVDNWEKVNFSKDPELNRKWDQLIQSCTGTAKVETGVEAVDKNNELIPAIGSSYGYIWESVNYEAQLYTTLAFDGLVFRSTAFAMNGETDSGNFTKIIDISGSWTAIDSQSAEGVIRGNNVRVSWNFSSDYSTLTNNKGVVFKRVKVK
jgi:hypothetical protein